MPRRSKRLSKLIEEDTGVVQNEDDDSQTHEMVRRRRTFSLVHEPGMGWIIPGSDPVSTSEQKVSDRNPLLYYTFLTTRTLNGIFWLASVVVVAWLTAFIPMGVYLAHVGLFVYLEALKVYISKYKHGILQFAAKHTGGDLILPIHGIQKYVRNPHFTGLFCLVLGLCFILGSFYSILVFCAFCLLSLIFVMLVEEPYLRYRYGEKYKQYEELVPRWLPYETFWNEV